jgi:radical SAM superfamily enzyme YgiQ (UPF0313 family)
VRVLLVDPPDLFLECDGVTRQCLPTGLASLAGALRGHHDVTLLLPDARSYRGDDPWGEIARAAVAWAPDVIGITSVTATFPAARKLVALFSRELPGVPIVLGGVHATFCPEEASRVPGVHSVVAGEGEETFPALLAGLEAERAGRPFDAASLPGVYVTSGNITRHGPEREPIRDLDALPILERDRVLWKDDLQPAFYQAVITLRGCPYRCIYCSVPNGPEGKTRYRSPTAIADEIALIRDRHNADYIFYHDSVFTLHRRRTLEICDALAARDLRIPFACQTRADRVDEALLDRLCEIGLHQVFFGIESGDRNSLALIRKDMPLEKIRTAVEWVKARGVRASGFFMVGFPWETPEMIRRTADFACELGLDTVSLFSATPLPGTELWEMSRDTQLPESIDFRTPVVNLTALATDEYRKIFNEVKAQIDAHNQARMMARIAWPGAGLRENT